MADENAKEWTPVCVASTRKQRKEPSPINSSRLSSATLSTVQSQPEATSSEESIDQDTDLSYFKSAEWTPDGTTLLTDSADHSIRTWILPPDLLEDRPIHQISPYSTLPSAEPTYATAIYPFYNLQDPSTTLFPLILASYSLVNPMTEAFITPHSMIYPSTMGGTHFLTGSDSLICLFDVSRTGAQGPVSSMPTIPSKRKQIVGGGIGMKGIVSALALNPSGDGILAAGTFTRHVGLYSSNGSGELLGTFSVAKTNANRDIGGRGVTQLVWSPCGRYLYVVERKSDGILVYDVRVTGQLLGHLRGRKAYTNQRMKIDVVSSGPDGSHEIWAGGTDGFMRVWRSPEHCTGGKDPDWEFKVHDVQCFTPMGSVVATCSGQRHFVSDDSSDEEIQMKDKQADNSLKVWSMPFLLSETETNHSLDPAACGTKGE
ncbi:hypothetical protein N7453_005826 [Penicillium expansum]|nr:hypothetical protein N7453_005826 [Penicillium expansum]